MHSRHAVVGLSLAALLTVPLTGVGARAAGAAAVPDAPRKLTAVQSGSGGARVSWQAPASDGGSAITNYVVSLSKAGVAQPARTFDASLTSRVLGGLQNGASYRFRVTAQNAVGLGAPSAQTGGITVGAPGQPLIMWIRNTAEPGVVQVRVNRGIVNQTNGSPVTRLNGTCTSANGGAKATGRMLAPPAPNQSNMNPWVIVRHLTVNKQYRCVVSATNSRGTGIGSKPSEPIGV